MAFVIPKLSFISEGRGSSSLFNVLRQYTSSIPVVITEFSLIVKHGLILSGSRDGLGRLFDIVSRRSHLPILSLTMALAHFHLTFVLVTIGKRHHSSFRRHRVVDKWTPVSASILEHHLAQSLKRIIIKLPNIENTICDIEKPVSAPATHLIVLEKSVVFVGSFEHTCPPTSALALFKFPNIFNP